MGNQYSITVSNETDSILKKLKDGGYMTSQVIDEAIKLLGPSALARLIALRRQLKAVKWMCRVCYTCFEVEITAYKVCSTIMNSLRRPGLSPQGHSDCPGCRIWFTCGSCYDDARKILGVIEWVTPLIIQLLSWWKWCKVKLQRQMIFDLLILNYAWYVGIVGMSIPLTIPDWNIMIIGLRIWKTRHRCTVQNVIGWTRGFGDHSESTGCCSHESRSTMEQEVA